MTISNSSSVFSALGYQVLCLELGVYVLTAGESDDGRLVALMRADAVPSTPFFNVELFVEPVPEGVAAADVVRVWQSLDARRLAETGLASSSLELGPVSLVDISVQSYARPDGGSRFVVALSSGDVVCLC